MAAVALAVSATACTDSTVGTAESNGIELVVDKALAQVGDQYEFGIEVLETDPDPAVWDQGEFTQWAAYQGGAEIPGSSVEQYLDLKARGLLIPVDKGARTRGALLFHFSSEPVQAVGRPTEAHVALSLGDGRTVEAQSEEAGVVIDTAANDRFQYAALLPGLNYADGPMTRSNSGRGQGIDTSGLTIDQVLDGIKLQESNGDYQVEDPTSTASGAYLYIDREWDGYGGYTHASDAPPAVQDEKMRLDSMAAYDRLGDWERVIAAHYAGEDGQAGPKGNWVITIPGDHDQNPSIRDYVDSVLRHIDGRTSATPTTTR